MQELVRGLFERNPEKILDLRAGDKHRDAVRESDHHGAGDELDRRAHAGDAQQHQHEAGHEGTHVQPIQPVRRDNTGDHHHKGAGRSSDLGFRPPEGGDQESGKDGTIKPGLRRNAGSDSEGQGQGQCDQTDGDPGGKVSNECREIV